MWRTDTLWFEVAMVMAVFAVGNILFGRFEEHKHRGLRLMKVVVVLTVVLTLSATAGRAWAFGVLLLPLLLAAWVHGYWLPRHGIDGWTAEPRDKYLELIGARARAARAGDVHGESR